MVPQAPSGKVDGNEQLKMPVELVFLRSACWFQGKSGMNSEDRSYL